MSCFPGGSFLSLLSGHSKKGRRLSAFVFVALIPVQVLFTSVRPVLCHLLNHEKSLGQGDDPGAAL